MTISIHALLAESDNRFIASRQLPAPFLSTLSLRRATCLVHGQRLSWGISIHALLAESDRSGHISKARGKHFYPRSPCGERPIFLFYNVYVRRISIHALLAESDTDDLGDRLANYCISIHALLAESDTTIPYFGRYIGNFYPRSPCGERHITCSLK